MWFSLRERFHDPPPFLRLFLITEQQQWLQSVMGLVYSPSYQGSTAVAFFWHANLLLAGKKTQGAVEC